MGFGVRKLVGYGIVGPINSGIWDLGSKGYQKHGYKSIGIWESLATTTVGYGRIGHKFSGIWDCCTPYTPPSIKLALETNMGSFRRPLLMSVEHDNLCISNYIFRFRNEVTLGS